MTRQGKSQRAGPIEPEPSFEQNYLDVDGWPHRWRVEPRDLRCGEQLLDIFKPFRRVDQTRADGLGLGLFIVNCAAGLGLRRVQSP